MTTTNSSPAYARNPAHTIKVTPYLGRVVVETPSGEVLADTRQALQLQEASSPPVFYIPRADAKLAHLERTDHKTHCPFKGDASYFSVPSLADGAGTNAVWTYETPFDEVAPIREALAFYPNKVTIKATPNG